METRPISPSTTDEILEALIDEPMTFRQLRDLFASWDLKEFDRAISRLHKDGRIVVIGNDFEWWYFNGQLKPWNPEWED